MPSPESGSVVRMPEQSKALAVSRERGVVRVRRLDLRYASDFECAGFEQAIWREAVV